jgi:TRAP-type mannitol/chloroaromatic compound transport system permease large subunit
MGAAGALVMAIARRRLSFKLTRQAMETTAKLSTVRSVHPDRRARLLAHLLRRERPRVGRAPAAGPAGRQIGFLIVVNILVFLLAFFLDFFELSFIVVPLLGPVAEKLGIDLIWFGVLLGVNMQTSFMHPPFGFALFYLRSVAPARDYIDKLTGIRMSPVTTGQIYWGAIPFVIIQLVMVALLIFFPQMSLVYKSTEPEVDPSKVKIEIPAGNAPSDTPDDILRDLQKGGAAERK